MLRFSLFSYSLFLFSFSSLSCMETVASGVPLDPVMDHAPHLVRTYMDGIEGRVHLEPRPFNLIQYCDDEDLILNVHMHKKS